MTRIEKIQNMTANELAQELYKADCDTCPCDKYNYRECYSSNDCRCIEIIEKWLNSECKD